MTTDTGRRHFRPAIMAFAIAVAAFVFGVYFGASDLCLDSGGRVTRYGFGCEDAAGTLVWSAVPGRVLAFATLFAAGSAQPRTVCSDPDISAPPPHDALLSKRSQPQHPLARRT